MQVITSEYNSQVRQWGYIFGLIDESGYAEVPRVRSDAEIVVTPPLEDHPLVGEILADYASEISTNSSNEVGILVAHGPTEIDDNQNELASLGRLAKYVQEDGGFSEIKVITLQNDAPKPVRSANVEKLKGRVAAANQQGQQVLIVPYLITPRNVQSQIREELA